MSIVQPLDNESTIIFKNLACLGVYFRQRKAPLLRGYTQDLFDWG
jgi:hypothetical protein